MNCTRCGNANSDGRRFCGDCGAPLVQRCPACDSEAAPGQRFCGDCGALLGIAPPASATAPVAERRQLTVMFCDLVGSVALGSRLDPEDMGEVIAAYHDDVAVLIKGHGGFVARYIGDGILAYFGYPQAREEDAERAVRAGLSAVATVARLETVAGPAGTLQARVGIASGLVVVGDMPQAHLAVGDTLNLGARLQTFAQPGTVVTDAATRRQIGGLFVCQELGAHELKGFLEPVAIWRVDAENPVQNRFVALRSAELAPLEGRDGELDSLLHRWRQARQGKGRLVLLSGEAGIGKSRLVAALEEKLSGEAFTRLRYFCSPHNQDSALHPVIAQVEHAAGFLREDAAEEKRRKLLALLGPTQAEDITLLSDLLSLPPGDAPALKLTPQRRKERTFEALMRQLERLAPAMMVFEDAHWADPSSRELLDLLTERLSRLPILVLVTFRPEFQPPWLGRAGTTLLALSRLGRREAAAIAARVAGATLSGALLDRILTESDGIPLFLEEITKAVLEDRDGERIAVPVSLKASLMARLDRLPTAKEVAQIGATIGRVFPYELVAAVGEVPETRLRQGLDDLVASGLAFRRGIPPDATYTFKHALVQDAAYESLLRTRRAVLHGRVADALLLQDPEIEQTRPELLGQHCAEAGRTEEAVRGFLRAGQLSAARGAFAEALAHLGRSVRLIGGLAEGAVRNRHELEAQTALGAVRMATEGIGHEATGRTFARAQELWEKLDYPPEFLRVPWGRWVNAINQNELPAAHCASQDILRLGQENGEAKSLSVGHLSAGITMLFRNRLIASRSHLEKAQRLWISLSRDSGADEFGMAPGCVAAAFLGSALSLLGYGDQARVQCEKAVEESARLGHAPTLTSTLAIQNRILLWLGDRKAFVEGLGRLRDLAEIHGFPQWTSRAAIYTGWLMCEQEDAAKGLVLMRLGAQASRAAGERMWETFHDALLAAGYERHGDVQEALHLLIGAIRYAEASGGRLLTPELMRRKGELHVGRGEPEIAEELFSDAIGFAREHDMKLWELRAATSLARLQRQQGRKTDARELLASVYGWFTEGFDTAPLKEARALLDGLT